MKKYLSVIFLVILFIFPSPLHSQDLNYCKGLDPQARCADTYCRQFTNCDTGGEGLNYGETIIVAPTGTGKSSQNQNEDTESMEGRVGNPVLPNITSLTGTAFLQKILRTGIVMTLITGSIVFFFILTSGGIKWLSSSGDKTKLESAQKQISAGLVGLAILLSSFAVIKLIETLFGIDLLKITLPTL